MRSDACAAASSSTLPSASLSSPVAVASARWHGKAPTHAGGRVNEAFNTAWCDRHMSRISLATIMIMIMSSLCFAASFHFVTKIHVSTTVSICLREKL